MAADDPEGQVPGSGAYEDAIHDLQTTRKNYRAVESDARRDERLAREVADRAQAAGEVIELTESQLQALRAKHIQNDPEIAPILGQVYEGIRGQKAFSEEALRRYAPD